MLHGSTRVSVPQETNGFGDAGKDGVGGLGDEDGRVLLGGPDDVDFLGGFVGVLELSLDAAGDRRPVVQLP